MQCDRSEKFTRAVVQDGRLWVQNIHFRCYLIPKNTILPSSLRSSGRKRNFKFSYFLSEKISRNFYSNFQKMKPKNGKVRKEPLVKINRENFIKVRVTAFEKIALQTKAEQTGLGLSEYLRRCGLGREIPVLPTSEEVQAYIELKNLEINFKRISNLYLHTKNPYYQDFINEIKIVINEVRQRLTSLKNGQ